ncbi:MAG: hypothetical protein QHJ73_05305 [Armatimonadota bacterium]|nr:hypothetical protein [Armatimonadota bacterium]
MKQVLPDVPSSTPPRCQAAGARYICPQCWRRVDVLVPLGDPPLCTACDVRTILLHRENRTPPAEGDERQLSLDLSPE